MSGSEIDLDLHMLEGLRDLLGEKFTQLVETYNSDCEQRLSNAGKAIAVREFSVINHEAHGVKGSSRNIGANGLAKLCGELESKAKAEDDANIEQLFSAIEQEFAAVKQKLTNLL